ncbi:MAG: hypothetical protein JXC36_08205 [Candidatus Atribacteria bacterium]|nr:hypothetical protein [Candidatus Atribacteria bacterium]
MEENLLKQMKDECKNSFFLDEEYDIFIRGFFGRTDSVIYDIDGLAEYYLITMNCRQYDFNVAMNAGVAYYEFEDALKYWKRRFEALEEMQRRGQLNGKIAPTYFISKTDDPEV